jgi:6-pyruvoyltetrahydropterin/6-carboxytetrahydropterin synthase
VFTGLDEKGMGADFSALRKLLHAIVRERFDHRHLNDVEPFTEMVPTAENLAREFFRLLAAKTPAGSGGRLSKVEVWEGPENFVAYEE